MKPSKKASDSETIKQNDFLCNSAMKTHIEKISRKVQAYEPWVFFLIAIWTIVPVWSVAWFSSMDGPAHQYNAQLIKTILQGSQAEIGTWLQVNSLLLPNWLGHGLLVVLQSQFPAQIVNKIMLSLILLSQPYAFRYLLKAIKSQIGLQHYLIFPLSYSLFFIMGFYNFLCSLPLMLFTFGVWMNYSRQSWTRKRHILISLLIILTYYAHLFSLLWLLACIGMYELKRILETHRSYGEKWKDMLHSGLRLLLISFPALVLVVNYFTQIPTFEHKNYLSTIELTEGLKNMSSLISLHYDNEWQYLKYFRWALILIGVMVGLKRIAALIAGRGKERENKSKILNKTDWWLIPIILLLLLYYTLPDSDGLVGYVSVRLAYMALMFFILWLAIQELNTMMVLPIVILGIYAHFGHQKEILKHHQQMNPIAKETVTAGSHIKAGSVVLPVQNIPYWYLSHFSNYLGVEKPMIVLENYEADNAYFPLKWQERGVPKHQLPCFDWRKTNGRSASIDYVYIMGDTSTMENNPCNEAIKQHIRKQGTRIFKGEVVELYKMNH